MIPVVVWGACGRMGGKAVREILTDNGFRLEGAVDLPNHPLTGLDAGSTHGLEKAGIAITHAPEQVSEQGVVLDFSLTGGPSQAARWAAEHGWALVSGSTAISEEDQRSLKEAAQRIPVLTTPNFSIGIQMLLNMVAKASAILPEQFEIGIAETHHRAKKDRPSGTARAFENAVTAAGKSARVVDIASLRIGQIAGEHEVRFVSPYEEIAFTHKAFSRDSFVQGALHAVRWIFGREPGRYGMDHALGFKE
jgi:4-hydroxy-tetrahydrodipicolinate reductase